MWESTTKNVELRIEVDPCFACVGRHATFDVAVKHRNGRRVPQLATMQGRLAGMS